MILFKVDGKVILKKENAKNLPRYGEKIVLEKEKESVYRVIDVEHSYFNDGDEDVIVHMTEFKN